MASKPIKTDESTKIADIGRSVRSIVVEALDRLGYGPPGPAFLGRIETFAATLALWGSKLNLTSAPNDPHEIAFHIVDSLAPILLASDAGGAGGAAANAALAGAFTSSAASAAGSSGSSGDGATRVLDLGSGAGFPALILAAACPLVATHDFVLMEARRKRASFLAVAAAAMDLVNVRVDSSRSDSTRMKPAFDVVTARAFAAPAIVYRTAAAALKPHGRAIIYASPAQQPAIEQAAGDDFDPAVFLPYEVPRGIAGSVAHLIAVSRRRR